jgi:hypothetical protein
MLLTGVRDYAIYMLDPHGYIVSWNTGQRGSRVIPPRRFSESTFHSFTPTKTERPVFPARRFAQR